MSTPTTGLSVVAPDGAPEVSEGADLVDLLLPLVDLADGDVVAVTSKVVSKAEGRVRAGAREDALAGETARVVARRGPTTIVRTTLGPTMAAAGIDASNVRQGHIALLPRDPDASARGLRATIRERTGRNVGVVVTDTAGRAWREGQTDIAIGAAGLVVLESFTGRTDAHGNQLEVTAPAVADEIASLTELAQGKLTGRPFAVVRGLAHLVLPADADGPGAGALVRPEGADLFGYGAREAVCRAVIGDPADLAPFGAPAGPDEVVAAILAARPRFLAVEDDGAVVVSTGSTGEDAALRILAFAHGWEADDTGDDTEASAELRFRPATP